MASSNRHWPSMFKSKPCNSPHQWHHDINPSLCHRSSPYPAVGGGGVGGGGCEERSPEPKPRWNPRPEQIRILESIFNSGMVNPPRDEIRRIRTLLQEYGQVGDANVFYWFQNRKSRTKHKLRHSNKKQQTPTSTPIPTASAPVPTSPSFPLHGSPNAVVSNQLTMDYFLPEVQYPPVGATGSRVSSDVLTFLEQHDQTAGGYSMMSETKKEKVMMSYATVDSTPNIATTTTTDSLFVTPSPSTSLTASTINQSHLGLGESGALLCPAQTKLTVFINDVAFEVAGGPFNVRQSFGGDAVLLQSTGHPVVTDEWGVTLQSLQHGAFYYLVRTLAPPLCMRDVSSSDDIVLHHELPC